MSELNNTLNPYLIENISEYKNLSYFILNL